MDTRWYRLLFLLTFVEGCIAIFMVFATPSEAKNAWLFGYSKARVLIGVLMLTGLFLAGAAGILSFLRKDWFTKRIRRFEEYLLKAENHAIVLLGLASTIIVGIVLLAIRVLAPQGAGMLVVAVQRIQFMILWGIAGMIQVVVLMWALYVKTSLKPLKLYQRSLGQFLIVIGAVILSSIHWIILFFQLPVFIKIPHWFWIFHRKTGLQVPWVFLLMLAASLLTVYLFQKKHDFPKWTLVFLVLLGALLQLGYGFIDGKGIESLRENYTGTMHRVYAEMAADDPDLLPVITDYENLFAGNIFAGTKPPGVELVYVSMEKVSNAIFPESSFQGRLDQLTRLITWVFPILSFLVVIPLYYFSRYFLGEQQAILPSLLYIFVPNILLITLFLDQVLYPLLFLICIFCVFMAIVRSSFWYSTLAGGLLYLSVFMTFSMIPAIFLAFLMVGLHPLILNRAADSKSDTPAKKYPVQKTILLSLGMLLGLAALFIVFRMVLHYDPFVRYANAMAGHRNIKAFNFSFPNFMNNLLLNNLDYGSWIGFPVSLLCMISLGMAIQRTVIRKAKLVDWLAISLFITFAVLNLLGQTQSETGRLWMFLNPILMLLASSVLMESFPRTRWIATLIVVMQLVTTSLIFVFQDFYG